jgi:hypothetical protein
VGPAGRERVNDRGERLFRNTLFGFGFDAQTVQDCWMNRTTEGARNTYRRMLRYYDEGLEALGIDSATIDTLQKAEAAMIAVGRWLAKSRRADGKLDTLAPTVVENVKKAVGVMYRYNSSWGHLSDSRALRAMIRNLKMKKPRIIRPLRLPVTIVQVWRYLRTLPPAHRKTRADLVRVAVVQARLLGRLRHTEVIQMDAEATDPTPMGWPFLVRLKGGTDLTEITIPRLREQALCAVHHLTELRDRLRDEKTTNDNSHTSFWVRENGMLMTTPHLRKASAEIMQAAGARNSRGYLLKHAMMTALRGAGMLAEDLSLYARHKPGSSTFTRYVDWSDSLKAGLKKVIKKR